MLALQLVCKTQQSDSDADKKKIVHQFDANAVQFEPYKYMAQIAPQRHRM